MMKDWFCEYIRKPWQKFYHQHILGETDWSDDAHCATQENSDHLATHIPPSENDFL